jgi:hypothetical protein
MIADDNLDDIDYDPKTGQFSSNEPSKTHKKYARIGKMGYVGSINMLLDILSKSELKMLLDWFSNYTDENNLLTSSFRDLTTNMDRSRRSKFKHKLIDNGIIAEHRKRLMLNPYIFKPMSTKHNYQYLTQRLWTYLFVDKDNATDEVIFHEDDVYGLPDIISTGSG